MHTESNRGFASLNSLGNSADVDKPHVRFARTNASHSTWLPPPLAYYIIYLFFRKAGSRALRVP